MKFNESHFWYNKRQRNGILLMVFSLTLIQIFLYVSDELFSSGDVVHDQSQLEEMNLKLDSMIRIKKGEGQKKEIYPFNPNYLSDFKGYLLGMSTEEIDRLFEFRKQGQYLKSAHDFQSVTGISDSILNIISPYFRFPSYRSASPIAEKTGKKHDLNKATSQQLQKIHGVGEILGGRIIAYRKLLGGYSFEDQIFEVYNLPEETARRVLEKFEILDKPTIARLNVNTASFREILALPYIDYDLTTRIMNFRREEKLITNLEELKKIDSFPLDRFDRIALYLLAE